MEAGPLCSVLQISQVLAQTIALRDCRPYGITGHQRMVLDGVTAAGGFSARVSEPAW